MTAVWRLLEHGPVDGALNMAIDRAVQLARNEGSAPPTLRLYRWNRPSVTVGRFQDSASIDVDLCRASGVDVVRRSTGGRGVLHAEEVTYSVIAGVSDGIPRGVANSYLHLCRALVAAYHTLGVDACVTTRDRGAPGSAACYLQTTRADVSIGDRKLSGSAQVWAGETVLQHGSFVLSRDVELESRVFRLDEAHAAKLLDASWGLDELMGGRPDEAQVRRAAEDAFAASLDVRFVRGTLTAREAELARSLLDSVRIDAEAATPHDQL